MDEKFEGVYQEGDSLYTLNSVKGMKVYTEKLVIRGREEYREWIPSKSKLAAAIKNGLETFPFDKNTILLYLGSATGTTPSHLSDIITNGAIISVEFSERMMREFMKIAEKRENLIPILADARKPQEYEEIGDVDIVYSDIAQPDQVRITIMNAKKFLKQDGYMMIAVKSRSIDISKTPEEIYEDSEKQIRDAGFKIIETIKLDPYEGDHAMIVAVKKWI